MVRLAFAEGELTVSTFGEAPGMGLAQSEEDKVLHSMLEVGLDMTLMAADVPSGMETGSSDLVVVANGSAGMYVAVGYFSRR